MTDFGAPLASSQQPQMQPPPQRLPMVMEYVAAITICAICTAIAYPFYWLVGPVNTVMLYLLATALAALRLSRGPCLLLPVTNILAFDFFFVPPTFSFDIEDTRYIFTLIVMLVITLVIAQLTVNIRYHRNTSDARERRTAVLYAMSRELISARDPATMAAAAVRHISAVFKGEAVVLIADDKGGLTPLTPTDSPPGVGPEGAALYDVDTAKRAAAWGDRLLSEAVYVPLRGTRPSNGVLVIKPQSPAAEWPSEQLNLLEAFAAQLAMSLQRAQIADEREAAKIAGERALLCNTLLASISHDLRTPLAAIAGAGSMIAQQDYAITADRRSMLGGLIERKAGDMTRLLSNVLDLAKLELGTPTLRADWHPLEDLVSHSLRTQQARLSGWRVTVDLPPDLPLIRVEATLIVQILCNLLENAVKYTPPGTTISISAAADGGKCLLVVADDGPGLPGDPERLFEKFQRGNAESNVVGVGLGLAICRAAARLHGGDIRAVCQPGGGARFETTLAVEMLPAETTADRDAPRPAA